MVFFTTLQLFFGGMQLDIAICAGEEACDVEVVVGVRGYYPVTIVALFLVLVNQLLKKQRS